MFFKNFQSPKFQARLFTQASKDLATTQANQYIPDMPPSPNFLSIQLQQPFIIFKQLGL